MRNYSGVLKFWTLFIGIGANRESSQLLKHIEPVYRMYPWKMLVKAGSTKRYNKAWHNATGIPRDCRLMFSV